LARALYTRSIEWLYLGDTYRFGIFDDHAPCGPRIVVVFAPKNQEPDLQAFEAESDILVDLERAALRYPKERESKDILIGACAVRSAIAVRRHRATLAGQRASSAVVRTT
jgi:hypothetical protein